MSKRQDQLVVMPVRLHRLHRPVFQLGEDFSLYRPATFVQRWYALTLDLAFFGPLNVLVSMPFVRFMEQLEAYGHYGRLLLLSIVLKSLPILFYFVIPTWLNGKTLGKSIVGLRVVTSDCDPQLTLGMVFMREVVGKLLCIITLGVGFLTMFANRRLRGLHDRVSGTSVVSQR